MLIAVLLAEIGRRTGGAPRFTAQAGRKLVTYDWPRNVRQLDKCLAAAVALAGREAIGVAHLPYEVRQAQAIETVAVSCPEGPTVMDDKLSQEEILDQLLRRHNGNLAAVARRMGTSRSQVHRLLRRLDLDPARYRRW